MSISKNPLTLFPTHLYNNMLTIINQVILNTRESHTLDLIEYSHHGNSRHRRNIEVYQPVLKKNILNYESQGFDQTFI